jgi:hypothetical protein
MAERKLGYDLVAVPPAIPLAQDIPLVDQLGQDPVGRAFGDPDRNGNVAQAYPRISGHAGKDVSVVRQKVPARGRGLRRTLVRISRSLFHE